MRTALYRHWDADGQLLYVGISLHPVIRLMQHRNCSDWFGQIAKVTIEYYDTREDAERAERDAIITEKPAHNVAFAQPAKKPRKEKPKVERFPTQPKKVNKNRTKVPSQRDLAIIHAHRSGDAHPSIADRFGITRERVRQIVSRFGEEARNEEKSRRDGRIAELIEAGEMTSAEIAIEVGVPRQLVVQIASKKHLKLPRMSMRQRDELEAMANHYLAGTPMIEVAGYNRARLEKLRRYCVDNGIALPMFAASNDNSDCHGKASIHAATAA